MSVQTRGVHHTSGIGGRAQHSIEFYYRVLGLRLVKRTVNYDDPSTYHLYFGDASGNPGSVLTLFSWPGSGAGHPGATSTREVALRVPPGALESWRSRLTEADVPHVASHRLGREHLAFEDPDGLRLAVVEGEPPPIPRPEPGADPASLLAPVRYFAPPFVPPEQAVVCIDHVTLETTDVGAYSEILRGILALDEVASTDGRVRLAPRGSEDYGARALELAPSDREGRTSFGKGSYHHVALEVENDEALEQARALVMSAGLAPTKIKERTYFRSVYFSGPGGAVIELATRGPGFTADEPLEELGLGFKLPEWLESERQFIRSQLPVTASPEYAHLYRPQS